MGQQQLLYIILVTIIVGFATLAALAGIDETHTEAGKEAIRQDIVRALGDAQAYYYKPSTMGGGGRSFDNLTIQDVSLESTTPNGEYTLTAGNQSLTLIGTKPSADVRIKVNADMSTKGSMHITWN